MVVVVMYRVKPNLEGGKSVGVELSPTPLLYGHFDIVKSEWKNYVPYAARAQPHNRRPCFIISWDFNILYIFD